MKINCLSMNRCSPKQKILIYPLFSLSSAGRSRVKRRFFEFHSSRQFHIPNHKGSLGQKCVRTGVALPGAVRSSTPPHALLPLLRPGRPGCLARFPPTHTPQEPIGPTCQKQSQAVGCHPCAVTCSQDPESREAEERAGDRLDCPFCA